jgi:hypothetical protein
MSQNIAVTVTDFSVTQCIDPKSKTEIPAKFKQKAIDALKSAPVDPPKGKPVRQPASTTPEPTKNFNWRNWA